MLTVSFVSLGIPLAACHCARGVYDDAERVSFCTASLSTRRGMRSGSDDSLFLTVGFAFRHRGHQRAVWDGKYRSLTNFLGSSSIHICGAPPFFGQAPWVVGMTVLMVVGLFFL